MIRRPLILLLPLALLLAGCQDRELPTALAPEGPLFSQSADAPVVNSLLDDVVPTEDNPGCTTEKCTLRSAIAFASPGATITFSLSGTGPHTIRLTSGQLEIGRDVTIQGPGASALTVGAEFASRTRIFHVEADATATLSGLTVSGGAPWGSDPTGSSPCGGIWNLGTLALEGVTVREGWTWNHRGGAGICNDGMLSLRNSAVRDNFSYYGAGGIDNTGTLALINSVISDNENHGYGGGISNRGGMLTLTSSTISGNSSTVGGAIYNGIDDSGIHNRAGTVALTNSTISGNSANFGGGIHNSGTLTLTHSTVSSNHGPFGGGAILNEGTLTLTNTILANSGGDCSSLDDPAEVIDGGYNIVQDGSCISSASTSRSGDPLLGTLQENGGPTKTHALRAGSPAIDAIPLGTNGCGTSITTDQRGVSRPQGERCDIGAFELQQASTPVFGGFQRPVRAGGLNVMNAGRTVPVNFSLGGDFGLEVFAEGYPRVEVIACPGESVARNSVSGTSTGARQSRLNYDAEADQYTYLWVTQREWAGTCRAFEVKFIGDETVYTLDFSFTR